MRKIILLCLVTLLTISCTKEVLVEPPLKYSFMPKYLDIDSVGPQTLDKQVVMDTTLDDFKSIPTDEGTLITAYDTLELPAGILISDKKAVEYIFYKSGYERQETMLKYSKYLSQEYYNKSLEAERLYQQEIVDLKKKARRSWLEKNRGYIGFLAGIMSAILTELAIIKVAN